MDWAYLASRFGDKDGRFSFSSVQITVSIREGIKKIDFFLEKVLNYGWVGFKSPKLVKM